MHRELQHSRYCLQNLSLEMSFVTLKVKVVTIRGVLSSDWLIHLSLIKLQIEA